MSEQHDALLLQLAYYFVSKYNYRFVSTAKTKEEIWLSNPDHQRFPVIRITTTSPGSTFFDKERILAVHDSILKYIQKEGKLLDIHATLDNLNDSDEDMIQVVINANRVEPVSILSDFNDLQDAVLPVKDPQTDYQRMVRKINEIHQANSRRWQALRKKDLPFVTMGFSFLLVAMYIVIQLVSNSIGNDPSTKIATSIVFGSYYKTFVIAGSEYWRFFTAGLIHIDFFHILINLFALMNLGLITERIYGRINFTIILILSIIMGTWFVFVGQGNVVTLGASGGLYGLMGALIVYSFESKLIQQPQVRSQFIRILLINLMISLLPGISLLGHVGGFVGGVFLAVILTNKESWKAFRLNSLIAFITLIGALGVLTFQPTKTAPYYILTDQQVLQIARSINLNDYANQMESDLIRYYRNLGVIE